MALQDVIKQIDVEIAKLQQAKALLSGLPETSAVIAKSGRRGRPKGSKNAAKAVAPKAVAATPRKAKRNLTPEGRKAIAEAMKRRWAERRKQAS